MSFLSLSTWIFFYGQVGGTFVKLSYSLGLFVGPLLIALKLEGGWWWWPPEFSVSPRPLGFGFGTKGFGANILLIGS